MDPRNLLEVAKSRSDRQREVNDDFSHRHFKNVSTSSNGNNPTHEDHFERRESGVGLFTPQPNTASTTNVTFSDRVRPGNSDEATTNYNESQQLGRLEEVDAPGTGNQATKFPTYTSGPGNEGDVTHYEESIPRDIFTGETVARQVIDYNMTSPGPRYPATNISREHDVTTESMNYWTRALRREFQESPGDLLPEKNSLPVCNVSAENVLIYGDLCNSSQIHVTSSSINETLSGPVPDYPWLDYMNATLTNRKSVSSMDNSSFTFDLSSWWSLMPGGATNNGTVITGSEAVITGSETILILKVAFLAFISVVGSFGNVMVIWSVVKERHLHRPPFYFLLSLGVTDLSRAVFCVPVVMTTVLHGSRWRHGESACKLFAFATSFFVFSSALSLLAIAIDRHICIIYSKTYRRRAPGIANLVVAIIIWIIAFSASFPPVVGVGDYIFIPDESQCGYQHKHYTLKGYLSSVFIFLAILFVTFSLYFRIFRFLRTHRRMRPLQYTPAMSSNWTFVGPGANGQAFINWLNGFGGQVPARQQRQRAVQRLNFGRVVNLSIAKNEHLTRLFLVLTVAFGLLWLPYVVLSLWRIFFDASLIQSAFVTVSAGLGYVQLALCPVVYFVARGPIKKPARTMYARPEKNSFLLENKVVK